MIKKIPSYTGEGDGGGCPIQQTSFNNQSADVKGTKWSTIKYWGGGVAIKNLSGQIIYFKHGSGARTFPDIITQKTSCSTFDS